MNKLTEQRLRIGLQKSGKLSEGSINLLNKCNFNLRVAKNHLLVQSTELNTDFLMVRDDDIPGFINSGVCDIGIIGENLFVEYDLTNKKHDLEIIARLKFAYCRLSIAVKSTSNIKLLKDLNGKRIATSYPATLEKFLKKEKISAEVIVMHGSVELAPRIGVADAICDLVSTGATLKENDLIELHTVVESEALLVGNKSLNKATREKVEDLNFRFQSVIRARDSKYIMLHIDRKNINKLKGLLPGCESPTVLDLQGNPDKVAVHVVSRESVLWDTIAKLKKIGASSILVVSIDKMMD